ncbi:hypothetical protein [Tenacibaculum salmonis]|uniref:hypothetical protein n=1 Tax=Tenacibaculum sp. P3-BQ1 TaxID=3232310 RepID=UPI0034DF31CC
MGFETELSRALEKFNDRDVPVFLAEVISVDKEKGTCEITDGELNYVARLGSVINSTEDRFFLYPKIKSKVLVAPIEEDIHQLYIITCAEIEHLQFKVADCTLSMDATGFNFKKQNESLRSLIIDLLRAIQQMKFTTNMGPTINLINVNDFVSLESKFENLLKDI